jgi:hypothetical protein
MSTLDEREVELGLIHRGNEVRLDFEQEECRIEQGVHRIVAEVERLRIAVEVGEHHTAAEVERRIAVEREVHRTVEEEEHHTSCLRVERHTDYDPAGIDLVEVVPIDLVEVVERHKVLGAVVDHKVVEVGELHNSVEVEVHPIHLVEVEERYNHPGVVVDNCCYSRT